MKWTCPECNHTVAEDPRKNKRKAHCPFCKTKTAWFQMFRQCRCGVWFHAESYRQISCSRKCAMPIRRNGKKGKHYPHLQRARIGNCRICGKEYRAVGDHKNRKQIYCSRACFEKGWAKFSRPNITPSNFLFGEKNKAWKGDFASYSAMHKWVARQKGKPSKCEHCGTIRARRFEWANRDHSYRREPDDYIRLCVKCHRRWDIENNNYRAPWGH